MKNRSYQKDLVFRREVKKRPCVVCRKFPPSDPCHIQTFKTTGCDEFWNIIPMCRPHHREQHDIGWYRMAEKYERVKLILRELGWSFLDIPGGTKKIYNDRMKQYLERKGIE